MEQFPKFLKNSFKYLTHFKNNNLTSKLRPLRDYYAVGFDVDHTLIRYQVKEIFPILCNSLYKVLIKEKGYPTSLTDFGTFERNFFMNGLVIDLKTGNILKLGEDRQILRAYFGYERLSQERIENLYGSPATYQIFDPNHPLTKDYFCCLSFFECYFPLVFAKMVETKRKGRSFLDEGEVKEILDDGFFAVNANYKHYSEEMYQPIGEFGYYFKTVLQNMPKVLHRQDRMLQVLKTLKEKEKILFLVSDSHYEYVDALMGHVYGEDWLQIFDFAFLNAKKPDFFRYNHSSFREIDLTKKNKMGKRRYNLVRNNMYLEGNATCLENSMRELRKDFTYGDNILFFGDHYCSDILGAKSRKNWDTVCVMEELGNLDLGRDYDGRIWGDWQYEETAKGIIPTYWPSMMMKSADQCVPAVDSPEMMEFYRQDVFRVQDVKPTINFQGAEI